MIHRRAGSLNHARQVRLDFVEIDKEKPYEIRGIKRIFNNYMLNKFHKINFSFVNNYFMKNKESEDCLYLNILTPTCERDKLPVLIYLTDTFFNFNTN